MTSSPEIDPLEIDPLEIDPLDIEQTDSDAYTIRTMTRDELALVVEWAAAEGWNPGLHDVDCFYAADPSGFLMGLLEGEPIASISAVRYGTAFGFVGFYIVRPAFRGHGYGLQIWRAGLAYLKGRNIGLDGVVEQQNNYIKSGFKLSHRNIRYEGTGASDNSSSASLNSSPDSRLLPLNAAINGETSLVELSAVALDTVMDYDKSIFLGMRSAFLTCWLTSPAHTVLGLVENKVLVGYGVLRPCRQGYKVGPLFADSPLLAENLFLALKAQVKPSQPFYLDVPSANLAAVALAQKYQMTSVFETARMYNKYAPDLPLNRIFGITTFELG